MPLTLFFLCSLLASLVTRNYLHTFTLSYLILFVSVVAFYSLIIINQTINQKDREHQKLLAVTLVTERDPAAEQIPGMLFWRQDAPLVFLNVRRLVTELEMLKQEHKSYIT